MYPPIWSPLLCRNVGHLCECDCLSPQLWSFCSLWLLLFDWLTRAVDKSYWICCLLLVQLLFFLCALLVCSRVFSAVGSSVKGRMTMQRCDSCCVWGCVKSLHSADPMWGGLTSSVPDLKLSYRAGWKTHFGRFTQTTGCSTWLHMTLRDQPK